MTKEHTIIYLDPAQQDLLDIFDYIKGDSPLSAERFIEKIDKTIAKLSSFPDLGSFPKDLRLKHLGYRVLVIDDFLVFYALKNEKIEIRRILHGKRRYTELF